VSTFRTALCSIALFLLAPFALAQGTYTIINVPSSTMTDVVAINNAGDLVGTFFDKGGSQHGFLLSQHVFTTIDAPGATATVAYGINDGGQIVGTNGLGAGFLYTISDQTFTTIEDGGAVTSPAGINNSGTIVGSVVIGSPGTYDGFELINGTYSTISAPESQSTFFSGINNAGIIVGDYVDSSGKCCPSFLYNGSRFHQLTIPGLPSATVIGINDEGAMVGYYLGGSGVQFGFVYSNGKVQRLALPRASVYASSINNSGVVVGYFLRDGGAHGFLWTPPAPAEKK
jgi:uncharacterized membrane protein